MDRTRVRLTVTFSSSQAQPRYMQVYVDDVKYSTVRVPTKRPFLSLNYNPLRSLNTRLAPASFYFPGNMSLQSNVDQPPTSIVYNMVFNDSIIDLGSLKTTKGKSKNSIFCCCCCNAKKINANGICTNTHKKQMRL